MPKPSDAKIIDGDYRVEDPTIRFIIAAQNRRTNMSETPSTNPQTRATMMTEPGLQILTQYVRDLSFEPGSAGTGHRMGQPRYRVDANVNARNWPKMISRSG